MNKLVNNMDKKEHRNLIIILLILISIIPILINGALGFYSDIGLFICLYFIGAYIRKYDIKVQNNKKLVFDTCK